MSSLFYGIFSHFQKGKGKKSTTTIFCFGKNIVHIYTEIHEIYMLSRKMKIKTFQEKFEEEKRDINAQMTGDVKTESFT